MHVISLHFFLLLYTLQFAAISIHITNLLLDFVFLIYISRVGITRVLFGKLRTPFFFMVKSYFL